MVTMELHQGTVNPSGLIMLNHSGADGYAKSKNLRFFSVLQHYFFVCICKLPGAMKTCQCPACSPPSLHSQGAFWLVPHTQQIRFWLCPSWAFWFTWKELEQTPPAVAGHSKPVQTKHTVLRSHLCFGWSNSSKDVKLLMNWISVRCMDLLVCPDMVMTVSFRCSATTSGLKASFQLFWSVILV